MELPETADFTGLKLMIWHVCSGLQPGDLDPSMSRHHLTTMKAAYLKLRYLVDIGCVFVGHGLKKDFRMINLVVPPSQVGSPLTSPQPNHE